MGVAAAFLERQGRFGAWKTPRGVQNAPFSCDCGATSARKGATIAPFLPRRTLDLATMLWSDMDGLAVFPQSLARDLHAGGGFNAEGAEDAEDDRLEAGGKEAVRRPARGPREWEMRILIL